MITNTVTLEQGVTVTQLKGQIYLVAADGSQKLLVEGDVLPKGAVIMSPDGASFIAGSQQFNLMPANGPDDAIELAQNLTADIPDDIDALQQAILDGTDPTQAFEAAAAGGAPAATGGNVGGVAGASGNGGFVTIDRTGSATIAEASFDTSYNTQAELPRDAGGEDEAFDLTPPTISVVAPDNTNDSTPTITGQTDVPVGSTVTIVVTDSAGNKQELTTTVKPDGSYSVDVKDPLAEGSYKAEVSVTDPAGNTGNANDNGSVDVTAPTISVEAPDNSKDTTPTITGKTDAAEGSTVTIVVTDAKGDKQTLTATVDKDGNYSVDVKDPLAEGSYKAEASVIDPAGNTGNANDNGSVDVTAPTISVEAPDNSKDTTPTITGKTYAAPGSIVTIVVTDSVGNKQELTTTVKPDGSYSVDVKNPLAEGSYKAEASVTDPAGNKGQASDNGNVDVTAPTITVDAPDNSKDTTPTITGKTDAAEGSTVTLVVTDAKGDKQTLTATVDKDGNYSVDVKDPLAEGSYKAEASVTDPAGNTGNANDNGSVDATAPSISVEAPDNSKDTTPTITGQTDAAPGSIVTIVVTDAKGNQQTLTTTVKPDGSYSVDVKDPLAEGSYKAEASVTDPAGNTGNANDNGSVDVTAPTISVEAPDNSKDTTPTITGKTDAAEGSTVTIVVTDAKGDKQTLTATVDKDGNYSVDVKDPLAEGSYKAEASVIDPAGNIGKADDLGSVDTVAPELDIDLDPIAVGSDNVVNQAEAADKVPVTLSGTVSGDAKVGDTLTLTLGDKSTLTTKVVDLGNGQLGFSTTTTADKLAGGSSVKAEITVTDAAGNSSTKSDSENYAVDTVATVAPTVEIIEDKNNDGTIDHTEISGKVNVDVTLPAGAVAGDTLKVSGQPDHVLSADDITAGKVGYEYDRPADGGTISVTATLTDQAGNTSAEGKDSAVMGDTTATLAPTVTIVEDKNNDGTIDRTEISGKVNVDVTLPAGAVAGDTLKVSGQPDHVLSADDITAGKVGYEYGRPADGGTITVTATLTDQAGNTSAEGKDSAVMDDTTATLAPTVTIVEDKNNDGTIDRTEISGKVNVEVKLPVGAVAGDTLKVSGQPDRVLTADDITAGKVGYEVERPVDGGKLDVTATLTDQAGNTSAEGKDSAVMGDTTATLAPTVTIVEDKNNDGTIDRTEISGKVNVDVTLPAGAVAGDTLKVSGQPDRVLSADDITAGKVGYEVERPVDGGTITVTATLTDKAGNTSAEGRDSAVMGDTTATLAPTVEIIEDKNNDGTIDRTEISGKVNVEVKLPVGAVAGDTLKVSGQPDRVLSADDITAGKVGYEVERPVDGGTITVTATLTDKAGNTSAEGKDSAVMGDTTATLAPTVEIIEDKNNDGTIDRTEISGKVNVEVKLPVGAVAGDTLKVSGQPDRVLSTDDITAGKVGYEYERPVDGGKLDVTATLTDKAGNTSAEGKDSAVMGDTTATLAPTVLITEDTNNDGTISNSEISGTVGVKVTLPAGAVAGDVLNVTGQAPITLTQAQIDGKFLTFEYPRPADGGSIEVKATLTDLAGNVSSEGKDSAVMGDTTATVAPTVEIIEDKNDDGTIDRTEISGKVNVEVKLPVGAVAGDTLKVSGQPDRVLTAGDITAGKVGYEYERPVDGGKLDVTATLTDKAGNTSAEGKDSAVMGDTTATVAPTVEIIEDKNDDGTIDRTEISGKVNVEVKLPVGAVAGDTLKVSGQPDRVLTAGDITAGKVGYEYERPVDGGKLDVTATLTDKAGNTSAEGKDSAVMGDTTATVAPTVAIIEDKNDDGTIDRTEISGKVNVEVKLPVGAVAGDTLKVSGQPDRVLTADDITAGKVGYEYDRPADGGKLDVTATLTDKAGNVSPEGSDSAVIGDTTAPTVSNTTISYAENQVAGTVLGNIGAADGKGVAGIVFKDSGTNISQDGYYQINSKGEISLTAAGAKAGVNDFEQGPNSGNYVVVVSDAAGNKTEATLTLKETDVNEAPTTSGGYAQGTEDKALVLTWGHFKVSDVDANSSLSIKITSLPNDGVLQYKDSSGNWQSVQANQTFSKADIDAGKLQFKPDLHESSTTPGDGAGSSVGDQQGDYASFNYQVSDGSNLSTTGKFVVDIAAVADKPTLTLNNFQTVASIDFEDVNLGGREWRADISINGVQGASTVGVWNTLNSGGKVEVGTEKTYTGGSSTNKVMEIEANVGDKTLYTDINCEAGRFYQLGFDVAARLGNPATSDMTIKLVQLDASGNPISGTEKLLYNFDPTDSNWLRNQTVNLPIDVSGKYRLIFEAVNADSTGAILDNIKFQVAENKGYEDNFIKLSAINASFADKDGSETHTVTISGLMAGSILKDGTGKLITVDATGTVDITTGWSLNSLMVKPPLNFNGKMDLVITATATEKSNGHSEVTTGKLVVEVLPVNDVPVVVSDKAVVSEEGLLGGLADSVGNPSDQSNSKQMSGQLSISDADGDALNVVLVKPVGFFSSGNQPVTWEGDNSKTLIAKAGGQTVAEITIDDAGNYKVTLLKPLDHPNGLGENVLSFDVGVKVTAGGQTTHGTLTVTVEDDAPLAVVDDAKVDVVVDAFQFSGVEASWTSVVGGQNLVYSDGPDNDSANDQIRWGGAGGNKSGYGFADNDAALNGDIPLNEEIKLGSFTHYNYAVPSGSAITAATMQVTFSVTDAMGKVTPVKLTVSFTHNETPNNGTDPRDIITIGDATATFSFEGKEYTLAVLGFRDSNGQLVKTIYTDENASNSFDLIVKVAEGTGYTLPQTSGNVLTNDLAGADGGLSVIDYGVVGGNSNVAGTQVAGLYGVLTILASGAYTYQVTKSGSQIPADAREVFSYSMRDADGDISRSTLTISVNPVDSNGVPVQLPLAVEGTALNDTIVVRHGEKAAHHDQLDVSFGGALLGEITTSDGGVDHVRTGVSYNKGSADQVVSSGAGNDHVETGSGNDVIYAGKTGANGLGADDALQLTVDQLKTHHIMTGGLFGNNAILDDDGLLLSVDVSSRQADVVNSGSGNDKIYGQSGSDILFGHSGDDYIDGGSHNDALRGGLGNDILIGGLGHDVLRGDEGADTFVWNKGDAVSGSLTKDYIMDFNQGAGTGNRLEGDKLDLSDLLDHDGSHTQNDLKSLLSVFQDSQGVHLQLKESSTASVTQEIVLMNHTFDSLTGGAGVTANQVIDFMLTNNMLDIDK